MMKKTYCAPAAILIEISTSGFIASSLKFTGDRTSESDGEQLAGKQTGLWGDIWK